MYSISRHFAINPPGFFSRIRLSTPALVPKVRTLSLLLWNHYAPLHYQKSVVFHWVLKVTFAKDV